MSFNYTDINESCYSEDGKSLSKVNDTSPHLRISAKCEIIQDKCFYQLYSLISFSFEENPNLTTIGSSSFYECECLTIFNLSSCNGLKLISSRAFFRCYKVSEILFPRGLLEIQYEWCFYQSKYKSIEIHNSFTTIGVRSFFYSKIISIKLPESVKRIENDGFHGCNSMINVTFLGAIDYIGNDAFNYCDNLELIIFPNTSMIVAGQFFISYPSPKVRMSFTCQTFFSSFLVIYRNANVSISYINKSDLIITTQLFIMNSNQTEIYGYWGLNTGLTIPKNVTTIKERAFENSNIYQINFNADSNLSVIENYAFRNCSNLYSFDFSLIALNYIGNESFKDCIKLTYVRFYSSDVVVMSNAFENCINLVNVSNITNVLDGCFSGCTNLTNVEIRERSRVICSKSFANCYSLEYILIPSSVQYVSEYSFLNCIHLKSIKFIETNSLRKISNRSFSGCNSLQNISNFESDKYKCIDNTIYYKNETGDYLTFHLNTSLDKTLFINCSVICSYSFNECNNIYNITILPNTVSLIEKYSFNNCLNLQHINFPLSVETVESHSFYECHSIRCPLIIENTKLDYIRMIVYSGIPRKLIFTCGVYHDTRKLETPYIFRKAATTFLLILYLK
ncbi:hypothetical protein TVAG_396990 [Trichomonas vaginalis G3]|uniref:Surface antigen BspA-like n=1 Tax=Trichomonas vaginalis (strain ATCC PRA-98 / G3) TaxID=412133 RepID=A2DX87_TRIV3|nr:ribonuclease inhibitor domain-containing protein [Trichomonas vaginalis G3]EAY14969.1 hypothetical protein TVAG_396990 [Trichomonas vaginalis G3]KAI5507358.1 ribonuclease inhibitor domain-containing protein [Trichomonas vaginalis G3]|eukprot:XP_001327192.1 hypothetical protein [Trichomonas vaginalis G3]